MSIMIYGLEMPKDGEWYEINIFPNGEVCRTNWQGDQTLIKGVTAVQIPPHGDLIDKKMVSENLASALNKKNPPFSYPDWNDAIIAMLTAPTIIPAEEGE